MFVYSQDYTYQSHLSPSYLAELNNLCQRDYRRLYFRETIVCLDLDAYESALSGDNDATMDAATGIAEWRDNHASGDRHLLVELRFGYKSTRHFDLVNMKRKVAHSRDILNPELINDDVVFLYETEIAPCAISVFSRLSVQDKEIKKWQAMDVEGFNNYVVNRDTLPYEPENNLNEIEEDLKKKFALGGLNLLDGLVKYWLEQMATYNLRYKHAESDAIAGVILAFLRSLSFEEGTIEAEFLSLRIEDVEHYIRD
jgi:hypothetical protein